MQRRDVVGVIAASSGLKRLAFGRRPACSQTLHADNNGTNATTSVSARRQRLRAFGGRGGGVRNECSIMVPPDRFDSACSMTEPPTRFHRSRQTADLTAVLAPFTCEPHRGGEVMPPVGNDTPNQHRPRAARGRDADLTDVRYGNGVIVEENAEAIYAFTRRPGAMSTRALGVPFDDLGEVVEGGGEPLHHGGELENDEVADRRLPDRATLLLSWASSWSKAAGWRGTSLRSSRRLATGCVRDHMQDPNSSDRHGPSARSGSTAESVQVSGPR